LVPKVAHRSAINAHLIGTFAPNAQHRAVLSRPHMPFSPVEKPIVIRRNATFGGAQWGAIRAQSHRIRGFRFSFAAVLAPEPLMAL